MDQHDRNQRIDDLDPAAVARFGRLELLARLVVEGVTAGRHRSPFKGFSAEFAEHRPYGSGDEIRHIDWRAYGKTDRFYVREYEEETNLTAYLALDTSGSMGYAGRSIPKLEQARRLAALIAHVMIRQRDRVGLVTSDGDEHAMIPARSTPGHLAVLCDAMEDAKATGAVPLHRALEALAGRIRRRGLIVVFSDAFDDLDPLTDAIRHLRHRRHEVLLLHVLAPEEGSLDLPGPVRLRDLEGTGRSIRVDPDALRRGYVERFERHRNTLRNRLRAMGADYHPAPTDAPAARILLEYLARRSVRGVGGIRR